MPRLQAVDGLPPSSIDCDVAAGSPACRLNRRSPRSPAGTEPLGPSAWWRSGAPHPTGAPPADRMGPSPCQAHHFTGPVLPRLLPQRVPGAVQKPDCRLAPSGPRWVDPEGTQRRSSMGSGPRPAPACSTVAGTDFSPADLLGSRTAARMATRCAVGPHFPEPDATTPTISAGYGPSGRGRARRIWSLSMRSVPAYWRGRSRGPLR